MGVLSAGQPSRATFEVCGQFCPNLRKDRKSLRNNSISSALAKISSWVQKRNQDECPVLRELWVMPCLPSEEQGNPPLLAPLPIAFLLLQLTRCLGGSTAHVAIGTVPATNLAWTTWRNRNSRHSSAKFSPALTKEGFFPQTSFFLNLFCGAKHFFKLLN